jgi:hypothetical protein
MGAKFKYCLDGELVIKDLKATDTATTGHAYREGEVMVAAVPDTAGVRSAGLGIADSIIGVCNQDETLPVNNAYSGPGITVANNGATLVGTHALGTIENLKVIVNPGAVYAIEYSQASPLTSAATDTTITYASAGAGFPDAGGGWFWSYDTGELDYVLSAAVGAGDTVLTTLTGTDTVGVLGINLLPVNLSQYIELTADALDIAANADDVAATGRGVLGVILENRLESATQGSEILDVLEHNQQIRWMNTNAAYKDKTKAFAYVRFNHILTA